MEISTPALLFGSISLLLLAYSNRFFVIARLIRDLNYNKDKAEKRLVRQQIPILRKRLLLMKRMQLFGIVSFILCTLSLFALFLRQQEAGQLFFAVSVLALLLSLMFGLGEILLSTKALDMVLDNTEADDRCSPRGEAKTESTRSDE